MGVTISFKKISAIFINSFFVAVFFFLYYLSDIQNVSQIALVGILQYIWMIISWYVFTKKWMNVYLFFLVLSFFFYLGQPVLYLFNIEFTAYMTIFHSPFTVEQINTTLIFLLKGMALFHLGASIAIQNIKENVTVAPSNKKAMVFVGMLFFIVSVIPQLTYTIDSLRTTITVGYSAIFESDFRQGTGLEGGIPRFLSGFFKPSLLLLILGNKDNKKRMNFWMGFAVVFCLLMIASGQRGSNTLFILALIMVYHYAIKPLNKKSVIKFGVLAVIGVSVLSVISDIRNIGLSNIGLSELRILFVEENPFISLLGEMGFTLIACTTVMVYSPSVVPFNDGATYVNSLFGLLPNLFWDVNPAAVGGVDQVFKSFLLHYGGMGSSFIIEAYYNFGHYGLLIMPIFGYLIGRLHFSIVKASLTNNYLKLFMGIYLTTIVLWFVRSETITFWRNFGYYTVIPLIMVAFYTALARKMNPSRINSVNNMQNIERHN